MIDAKKQYSIVPSFVDIAKEHIKLVDKKSKNAIALVAPGKACEFRVQFLDPLNPEEEDAVMVLQNAKKQLDYYLVDKGEENPWQYAQYHCGTMANYYSSVIWSYFSGAVQRGRVRRDVCCPRCREFTQWVIEMNAELIVYECQVCKALFPENTAWPCKFCGSSSVTAYGTTGDLPHFPDDHLCEKCQAKQP